MLFKDVIGQHEIKQHLLEIGKSGNIPHSQLFLSQPGAGGLALALAFTQYIVCEYNRYSDSDAEMVFWQLSDKYNEYPDE